MLHIVPVLGIDCKYPIAITGNQPTNGSPDNVGMGIRTVVRMNLAALLTAAQDGQIEGPGTVLDLEALSGVGKTTIYRILDPEADYLLTLTTLIKLAAAYELSVWQFLYPQLYLDPSSRPHVLTEQEREEHEKWHAVYLQVEAIAHGRPDADNPRAPRSSAGNTDTGDNPGTKPSPKRPKAPRP